MTPSISLFDLIKSLSKSEKRYFKIYISKQKGNKNYLKLFSFMDSANKYDEILVKKAFKNEKFIRQLTFTKNYLFNLIFKSLYSYYSSHSIEGRLNDLIFRCNYFYKKALYREFNKSIHFGKKLSLEYERFGYFIQFSSFEKILLIEKHFPQIDESSILSQEELIIEKIGNLSVYDSYVSMLNSIYHEEGRTRDTILFDYIERIKQSPLFISEDYALSFLAKERYYYIFQIISDIYGDLNESYAYCKKRFNILSKYPRPFADRLNNYWRDVLMNLILYSIRFNNTKKQVEYLHLLETHSSNSVSDRIYLFVVQAFLSVQLVISGRRWDNVNGLMERIEIGLNRYRDKIESSFELILYDIIVRLYVESGNYSSALKYINLLLNNPLISSRRDIEYNARLLNLIIHYELKNLDYLEYLILSTYRFLYKRKKIFKLETYVINFIRRLTKINSSDEIREHFLVLQKELKSIYNATHEKNIFLYFNYLEWVNKEIKHIDRG